MSAVKPSVAEIEQALFHYADGDAARSYISNHARRYCEPYAGYFAHPVYF